MNLRVSKRWRELLEVLVLELMRVIQRTSDTFSTLKTLIWLSTLGHSVFTKLCMRIWPSPSGSTGETLREWRSERLRVLMRMLVKQMSSSQRGFRNPSLRTLRRNLRRLNYLHLKMSAGLKVEWRRQGRLCSLMSASWSRGSKGLTVLAIRSSWNQRNWANSCD